jgi:prophage regulatory protein
LEIFNMATSQQFFTSFFAFALLRLPAVLELIGDKRSKFYEDLAAGLWPQPVPISGWSVAWPAAEIAAINAGRIAGRTVDDIRALVVELEAARKDAPRFVTDLYFPGASIRDTMGKGATMNLQAPTSQVKEEK